MDHPTPVHPAAATTERRNLRLWLTAVGYPLALVAGIVAGNVWRVIDAEQTSRNIRDMPLGQGLDVVAYRFGWSAFTIAALAVALVVTAALVVIRKR